MNGLAARVSRLEGARGNGPMLISWQLGPSRRATAVYADTRYTQADDEDQAQFFARLRSAIPAASVVWIDELDENL